MKLFAIITDYSIFTGNENLHFLWEHSITLFSLSNIRYLDSCFSHVIAFSNSNTPSFKKYGGKFDIPLYYYNYDSGMMRGIQSANLFCNNNFINNINQNKNENQTNETLINNNSNKNQKIYFNKGKKGRPFTERSGDWVCANCRNLNFAFRIICNRCHLPKIESEKFVNGKFEKVNNSPNENNYKYSNPPKDVNTDNSIIDVININDKK